MGFLLLDLFYMIMGLGIYALIIGVALWPVWLGIYLYKRHQKKNH